MSVFLLACGALILTCRGVVAADPGPAWFTEFQVPGQPRHVDLEGPGRIWFTLPQEDAIGRLVVTSTTEYAVSIYTTTVTEPYDLKFSQGYVWFTGRAGNQVGRLDILSGNVVTFPVPTADSQPARLDVLPGSPTVIWFAESGADSLASLTVTDTTDFAFAEYPLPTEYTGAVPEDIAVWTANEIWFSAPGVQRIGRLIPSRWGSGLSPFFFQWMSDGTPLSLDIAVLDGNSTVFVVDPVGNRLMRYFPQTLSVWLPYPLPYADSSPYDLVISGGKVWFTEQAGGRVGWLDPGTGGIHEYARVSGDPLGLDRDGVTGCVWFAEEGGGITGYIGMWCPPYLNHAFLPLVLKGS